MKLSTPSVGKQDPTSSKVKILQVKVKPNAKRSQLTRQGDGTWLAQLCSLPIDGKANQELIALVAAQFGCRKADVCVKTGAHARVKLLSVPAI